MFSPDDITPEQQNVIESPLDRDLYIEAPAGYGKTTTAMLKAAEVARTLVHSPRQQVLVLTFSKMAVRQIDHEKRQHVPKPLHPKILIKTYHSFYFDLIRQYARYLGFKHADIDLLTSEERIALHRSFIASYPRLDYLPFSCAQYLAVGISPPMPVEGTPSTELVATAASFLEDYHKQEHRLGFDDFAYYAYRVLNDSSFTCGLLAYKHPVVFLDEFQNTDDLQWTILKCFIRDVKLIVLADPNQKIHGFRGAGRAIDSFKSERRPHPIPLGTNFRHSSSLCAFATRIATGTFDASPPSNVTFHRLEFYNRDKWRLKLDILNCFSTSIRSIAVLTKTNRAVAELSDLFARKTAKTPAIAHQVVADDFSSQDQENVVLSLFQLIATCDLRYLTRVASSLSACSTGQTNYPFYLSQAAEIRQCTPHCIASSGPVPGVRNARTVLRVIKPAVEGGAPAEAHEAWQRTERVLQGLTQIRSIPDLSPAYLRVKNQWNLLESRQGAPTLETYLRHLTGQRRRHNFREQRSYLRGLFLMTLHQSQGRQFDAVFIWRCNDGIIPHPEEIRKGDTRPSQYLLYVGITRARHLVRIYYEKNQRTQPSRLIRGFLVPQ